VNSCSCFRILSRQLVLFIRRRRGCDTFVSYSLTLNCPESTIQLSVDRQVRVQPLYLHMVNKWEGIMFHTYMQYSKNRVWRRKCTHGNVADHTISMMRQNSFIHITIFLFRRDLISKSDQRFGLKSVIRQSSK